MSETVERVERQTRNEFTADELNEHLDSGEAQTINEDWLLNPNYDEEYNAWGNLSYEERLDRENHPYPEYTVKDENGNHIVTGEQLIELEDFWYEVGYVHGFGEFEAVDSWNLGDGHECGTVIRHKDTGRLFRKTGWYSSWDSGAWDGPLTEVEAVEVVSLKYRDKGSEKVHEYPLHVKEDE